MVNRTEQRFARASPLGNPAHDWVRAFGGDAPFGACSVPGRMRCRTGSAWQSASPAFRLELAVSSPIVHPVSLTNHDDALVIARLSATEGLARSLVTGVVPVAALDALGSKAAVSYAYLVGAFLTVLITLNLGAFERRVSRQWVLSTALLMLVVAAGIYSIADGPIFALGIGFGSSAASMFAVCISLFTMDAVEKRDLARTEARRIRLHGIAWMIGPLFGLWIAGQLGPSVPLALSAAVAIAALATFWSNRPGSSDAVVAATSQTPHPWAAISRFFKQPRLRLAYAITTVRSVFWTAVFVYGPIYVVEAGLPRWVGGAVLSIASSLLLLSPVVSRLAHGRGVRWVIGRGFVLIAGSMAALALIGPARPIGLVAWGVGAVGAASLDVVGNIPFMRMVKQRERVAMTGVFSTWREVSGLVAPALAAGALALGSFRLFYMAVGVMSAGMALAATLLPKRL